MSSELQRRTARRPARRRASPPTKIDAPPETARKGAAPRTREHPLPKTNPDARALAGPDPPPESSVPCSTASLQSMVSFPFVSLSAVPQPQTPGLVFPLSLGQL